MAVDVRRIDRHGSHHPGRAGQGVENAGPDALPAPPVEAVVDRCVRAITQQGNPATATPNAACA